MKPVAHKNIQKLLDKEMNRRMFLAHIGAGILTILGFSGLIKSLLDYSQSPKHVDQGYGASTYGTK